jgi:hypothetical protein
MHAREPALEQAARDVDAIVGDHEHVGPARVDESEHAHALVEQLACICRDRAGSSSRARIGSAIGRLRAHLHDVDPRQERLEHRERLAHSHQARRVQQVQARVGDALAQLLGSEHAAKLAARPGRATNFVRRSLSRARTAL